MSEKREPEQRKEEDAGKVRSGLKRPKEEVKDLETPDETAEDIRGGIRASKFK